MFNVKSNGNGEYGRSQMNRKAVMILVVGTPFVILLIGLGFFFTNPYEPYIPLESPQLGGTRSIEESLLLLRPIDDFSDEPLTYPDLSQILWAAQGITDPVTGFRGVPSAGALYPLEVYVVIGENGVASLEEGVYHFLPEVHGIEKTLEGDQRSALASATGNEEDQVSVETAPVSLVVTAVYERTTSKYREEGYRYVHLEVGHLAQNVFLQAIARDLGTTMVCLFNETQVQGLLSCPEPLLIMPIGESLNDFPVEQPDFDDTWLPYPDFNGSISVETAIPMRRSIREYASGNLTIGQVSQLLWAAQGVKGADNALRTTPPIRGIYSVELFIAVGNVTETSQGVYYYEPENHSLHKMFDEDVRQQLFIASGGELYPSFEWVKRGRICIVLTIIYDRCTEVFGDLVGERVARFQAGMVAQNIHLQTAVLGLGTVTVGAFWDDAVQETLQVPVEYAPMYLMPIGQRPLPED
jgi:SagB-type dehydrogenase family enzyme